MESGNFSLAQIPLAARRLHGYHIYRAINNYHDSLVENLGKWVAYDMIDATLSPKYKSILYFFINPTAIKQVTSWYLYLYFSHDLAARVLNRPAERTDPERILFLRGFDSMNVAVPDAAEELTTTAGMVFGVQEAAFRVQLEEAVGRQMRICRIISPMDHYWDTSLVESVADQSFYDIAEFVATRGSFGIITNSRNWKEQVSRIVGNSSRIVVLVPRPTPGVLWELSEVRRQGRAANCLIVIPHDGSDEKWRSVESEDSVEALGAVVWEEKRTIAAEMSTVEAFLEHHSEFRVLHGPDYKSELARELAALPGAAAAEQAGPVVLPFDMRGGIPQADLESLEQFKSYIYQRCRRLVEQGGAVFPPWVANWIQHVYLVSLITQDHGTAGKCMALLAGTLQFYSTVYQRYHLPGNGPSEVDHARRLAEYTDSLCLHLAGLFLQVAGESPEIAKSERRACAERLFEAFQDDLDREYELRT